MTQKVGQEDNGDRVANLIELAESFIQGSRVLAEDLIDKGDNAMGYLGFAYGAIDAFCHRAGLDPGQSSAVLELYLARAYGQDEAEVKIPGVLRTIRDITGNPEWAHSIGIGGQAAIQFMDSEFRAASFFQLQRLLASKDPK